MFLTKVRTATTALLVLLAGIGNGMAYHLTAGEQKRAEGKKETPAPPAQAADTEGPLKKALLEEARKVYEQNAAFRASGPGPFAPAEEMYRWSRRWLEAQLDLAAGKADRAVALRNHLERMKGEERMAQAMARTGQGRQADVSAATYYRLQAELWLSREQAK